MDKALRGLTGQGMSFQEGFLRNKRKEASVCRA